MKTRTRESISRAIFRLVTTWDPKPIPPPQLDPQVTSHPALKRIAEILRFRFYQLEWVLSKGGTLRVRTLLAESETGPVVRIEIKDTGTGISEDQLDKIFTPFYTSKTQGTGLGLPICRQLLEQHDGTIQAVSTVAEGTTFIIELPANSGTLTFKEKD